MGLFDLFKKKNTEPTLKNLSIIVAGTDFYQDVFLKFMKKNRVYSFKPETIIKNGYTEKNIYKYKYTVLPADLIPEPSNKYDKNAIKILVNGEKIGYIPSDQTKDVKNIIASCNLEGIEVTITGGGYKIVLPDSSECISDSNFYATLNIKFYK